MRAKKTHVEDETTTPAAAATTALPFEPGFGPWGFGPGAEARFLLFNNICRWASALICFVCYPSL